MACNSKTKLDLCITFITKECVGVLETKLLISFVNPTIKTFIQLKCNHFQFITLHIEVCLLKGTILDF